MTSRTNTLVSEYLERVGGDVLESEHFRSIVARMVRGHAGVYALYKDVLALQAGRAVGAFE